MHRLHPRFLTSIALITMILGPRISQATTTSPALIEELCQVMQLEKSAEAGAEMMLQQMESQLPQMMEEIMGPVDPKDAEKAEKRIQEFKEFNERFNKRYRELLKERVKLGAVIKEIYAPLFDKYFTEAEIRDLIKFYRTPLGQRLLTQMPLVMQDYLQRANEVLNPKLIEVVRVVLEEEKQRAASQKPGSAAPVAPAAPTGQNPE